MLILAGAYAWQRHSRRTDRDDSFRTLSVGEELLTVAFDPRGRFVAAAGWDNAVTIWDVNSGREVQKLRGHTDRIYEITFSLDGLRIASGSKDHTTRIWTVGDGSLLKVLNGHRDRVMSLALSHDGKTLVTGSRDGTLKLWNFDTYQEVDSLAPHRGFIPAVAFSPDGSSVLLGDWNGGVSRWKLRDHTVESLAAMPYRVHGVAFNADGTVAAFASRGPGGFFERQLGLIRFFDTADGHQLADLRAHMGGANAVAFSPDGALMATAGADGLVILWDARDHTERRGIL